MIYVLICPLQVFPILVLPPIQQESQVSMAWLFSMPFRSLPVFAAICCILCKPSPSFHYANFLQTPHDEHFPSSKQHPKKKASISFLPVLPPLSASVVRQPHNYIPFGSQYSNIKQETALLLISLSALQSMTTCNHWGSFYMNTETGIYKHI